MIVTILILVLQISIAVALGAFLSLERRMAGGRNDIQSHAFAAGCAAFLGFGAVSTGAHAADFVFVSGIVALGVGALTRDFAVAWASRRNGGQGVGEQGVQVDGLSFTGALWAGASCGFGDPRACIFVVLALAIVSMFRSREPSVGVGGAPAAAVPALPPVATSEAVQAVYNPARDLYGVALRDGIKVTAQVASLPATVRPQAVAPQLVMQSGAEPNSTLADAAEHLAALAAALRETARRNIPAHEVFEQLTMSALQPVPVAAPVAPRARLRVRETAHNVVSRNGGSQQPSTHVRKPGLQRANFRPVSSRD